MGNRGTVTWAATSVPEIRRQWCAALDSVAAQHAEGLKPQTGSLAGTRRLARMQDSLAKTLEAMAAETEALRAAQLYWVSRDMTTTVVEAAETLPEWTPAVAVPAPAGLLCWARPAGTCSFTQGGGASTDVAWDALFWFTRADGVMQLTPASRLAKDRDLLAPFNVASPLWGTQTVVLNPQAIRTEESTKSTDAHQFVSILGAAWLLMGQKNFADTTRTVPGTIADRPAPGTRAPRPPQTVTLVDIRRPSSAREKPEGKGSGHGYDHRFWVASHWRDQPWGPNNSQRKPKFIEAYLKGPEGAPLKTHDKVRVLRH